MDKPFYALALGVFVLCVHMLKWELVGFTVITLCVCFTNLFARDTRSAIPPLFLITFVMGQQNSEESVVVRYFTAPVFPTLIALGVILIGTAIYRLIADKKITKLFCRTRLLYGFIALSIGLLLGGLFSNANMAESFAISGSLLVTGLVFYVFFAATMEHRKDNIKYLSQTVAVAAGVIALEIAYLYITKYTPGRPLDGAWKGEIIFGWGISNAIGEMLTFLLAPIFYLAFSSRRGWLYYLLAVVVLIAVFFTLSRNALLFGALLFAFCTGVCIISGKNSVGISIAATVLVIAAAVFIFVGKYSNKLDKLFAFFIDTMLNDRGRFVIWEDYWNRFTSYPVFGMGFGTSDALVKKGYLAHNTVFQMLGSCGIVGILTYIYHRYETVKIYLTKPTSARSFMGFAVLAFLLMSLLDPTFFYAHFIIYYTLILTVSEKEADFTAKNLLANNL